MQCISIYLSNIYLFCHNECVSIIKCMVINFFTDNFTEMSLNFTAPTVSFSSANYAVSESAIALLTLVINQSPISDIFVSISFLNGTATGIMYTSTI